MPRHVFTIAILISCSEEYNRGTETFGCDTRRRLTVFNDWRATETVSSVPKVSAAESEWTEAPFLPCCPQNKSCSLQCCDEGCRSSARWEDGKERVYLKKKKNNKRKAEQSGNGRFPRVLMGPSLCVARCASQGWAAKKKKRKQQKEKNPTVTSNGEEAILQLLPR